MATTSGSAEPSLSSNPELMKPKSIPFTTMGTMGSELSVPETREITERAIDESYSETITTDYQPLAGGTRTRKVRFKEESFVLVQSSDYLAMMRLLSNKNDSGFEASARHSIVCARHPLYIVHSNESVRSLWTKICSPWPCTVLGNECMYITFMNSPRNGVCISTKIYMRLFC